MMIDDDAGGVKGTCMKTCDGRMVDEPCTRKGFLENRWIQRWLATHVFQWMVIFYMDFNNVYVCRYKKMNEDEDK
jgi:hypothetical protein